MRRAAVALALALAACGPGGPPEVALGLALSAGAAGRVRELQVEFVRPGSIDCERVRLTCLKTLGVTPVPVAGAQAGRLSWRGPFTPDQAGTALPIQVAAGTYLVNVEALDGAGQLVANGCKLSVELTAGASTDLTLALSDYGGPACDAGL